MRRILFEEIWKEIIFDFPHTKNVKMEVSSDGRVRSISPKSEKRILKGTLIEGYRLIRLKFFAERDAKTQTKIDLMREQIANYVRPIGKMRTRNKAKRVKDESYFEVEQKIQEQTVLLDALRKKYQKKYKASEIKRTINKVHLVHRLVAQYFIDKPSPEHTVVAHLDYDKLNNEHSNIVWMTRQENFEHQKGSPYVIAAHKKRSEKGRNENTKVYKLTSTKVMLIKKKINQGVALRTLAKNFKVTETQLLRIKRGENWVNVEAAK